MITSLTADLISTQFHFMTLLYSFITLSWINTTYPQVTDAMTKMHDRKNIGKLLLDLSMEPRPRPTTPAKTKKEEKKEDKENTDKDSKDSKENGKTEKEEEAKTEAKK